MFFSLVLPPALPLPHVHFLSLSIPSGLTDLSTYPHPDSTGIILFLLL
jgi:hypothetical protein